MRLLRWSWPILAFALLACRGEDGRELRIACPAQAVPLLDPVMPTDQESYSVLSNLYEGLAGFDPDMRLVPKLAESWTTPNDHTWVVRLRSGVRFHDGHLLAAGDVVASVERARQTGAEGVGRLLATVSRVEATGADEITFTTTRSDPLLMSRLASGLFIARPADSGGVTPFVGTGPYRVVEWHRGASLKARAFRGYWGGPPAFSRVTFVSLPAKASQVEWLRDGKVDVLRLTQPVGSLASLPGVRILRHPGLGALYLWFNTTWAAPGGRRPFAEAAVRRSLAAAIDRPSLCAHLAGGATPASQIVPEGVFGFIPDLPAPAGDSASARQQLQAAGYPSSIEVPLSYSPAGSVTTEFVRALAAQLATVGVRAIPQEQTWSDLLAGWQAHRLALFVSGWTFEDGDASGFLLDCVHTANPASAVGAYNPGFSSPKLDALIDANLELVSSRLRLAQYRSLVAAAEAEMPVAPLCRPDILYAASRGIVWRPRTDGRLLAAEMSVAP